MAVKGKQGGKRKVAEKKGDVPAKEVEVKEAPAKKAKVAPAKPAEKAAPAVEKKAAPKRAAQTEEKPVAKKAKQQKQKKAKQPKDEDDKKDIKMQSISPMDAKKMVEEMKAQARVAISSLQSYFGDRDAKSLFPDIDHALEMTVVYKKPALHSGGRRQARITLPNSAKNLSNASVCLIMPDLDQSEKAYTDPDVDKQSREWALKIETDHKLTKDHIARIVTKRELERITHTVLDKRQFASSYDVFLVDARVASTVRAHCGKEFHRVHKMPFEFHYERNLPKIVEESFKWVALPLSALRTRVNITVGHLGQTLSQLSENVDAAIDVLLKEAPGGLVNLRSIYLQPPTCKPSLPIFVSDGSANDVKLPKPKKKQGGEKIIDDCSVLPDDLKVEITKAGKVRVLREADGAAVMFPTKDTEREEGDDLVATHTPASLKANIKRKKNMREKIYGKTKQTAGVGKKSKKEVKAE